MSITEEAEPSTQADDAAAKVREATHPRIDLGANNFDAIRLGAALLVMVSHQFFFLGRAQPAPTGNTLGEVAVMIFFVISGYLVTESWIATRTS